LTPLDSKTTNDSLRKALGPAFTALSALVPRDRRCLLAVSGGSDSVGMMHVAAAWAREVAAGAGTLLVGFVDHGLREVDAEWALVADAAEALGLEAFRLTVPREDALAARGKGSVQAWARDARYGALSSVAVEKGAALIATAHTRDDQAETFLMRLLRGAGLDGLGGIPAKRQSRAGIAIVRPMLGVGRDEIRTALRAVGVAWAEDASNADPKYVRNRIRAELVPLMERLQPGAIARIAAAADELQGAAAFLERTVEGEGTLVPLRLAGGVRADATVFASLPRALHGRLVRHALRAVRGDLLRVDRGHYDLLLRLLADRKSTSRIPLPGGAVAYVFRGSLYAFPNALPQSPTGAGQPVAAGARLWRARFAALGAVAEIEVTPAAQGRFEIADLELRARRPGDRVMGTTKKMKEIFLARGVPRPYRDFVPLLALGDEAVSCPGHLTSCVEGLVVRWLLDDNAPFLDLDFPLDARGY
jgi:tRNA(Ile)-lysidine synthase